MGGLSFRGSGSIGFWMYSGSSRVLGFGIKGFWSKEELSLQVLTLIMGLIYTSCSII